MADAKKVEVKNAPATESVNRITAKTVKSIAIGKANGVKIAGMIRSMKEKPMPTDSSQSFTAFFGDFRAMVGDKILAADEFSTVLGLESRLKSAFGDGKNPVLFSVTLFKEEDTTAARKFKWSFAENKPIAMLSAANDPIMQLLN